MQQSIQNNIRQLEERIAQASLRSGRNPEEIQVILATKTVEPTYIWEAANEGYRIVGENRIKEAQRKMEQMGNRAAELEWHYIGHMQSNKVNKVVPAVSMVQSIDRMKIVRKMNRRLTKIGKTMDVLIQVNTSGEESKYGVHPAETVKFMEKVAKYERLNIKGLMTIGLFSDDWPKVRAGFRQLRELRDQIASRQIDRVDMEHLSMGMTNDFELAIEEGATMIRIGRGIFGERGKPDSYYWPGIDSATYLPRN